MTAEHESPTKPRGRGWLKLAFKLLLLLVLVGFWYIYVRKYWEDLRTAEWSIPWAACGASGAVALIGYLVRGLQWNPLCHEITGYRLGWLRAVRATSIAWMGRYIPGKIWSLAGKAYLSSPDRKKVAPAALAVTIDTLLSQGCGVLLAATLAWFQPNSRFNTGLASGVGVAMAVGAILICHPRVFGPLVNGVLWVLRQPPLERAPRFGVLLAVAGANIVSFICWGASLTLLAMAVADVGFGDLPIITALFAMAWVSGFLALIAPAGLGVRDSILVLGFQELLHMPPAQAVFVMLLSRVMTTLVEVLLFAVCTLVPTPRAEARLAS